MKIVVAPNAYKNSLSATEAALAMEEGIRRVIPEAEIEKIPVADGGDGLLDVAFEALGGEIHSLEVTGPANTPVIADYCHVQSRNLVTIEMALASGLALLPETLRNPALTTSYGTGELIKAALDLGVQEILVGIGGSATNDGGTGMAQALGVRFLDSNGRELPGIGASLEAIAEIDASNLDPRIQNTTIKTVCDVKNPLYGPEGAAFVYGPQKGAEPSLVNRLDCGLKNLAQKIERDLGKDVHTLQGGGAAGGLGAGLYAFFDADLCSGIELIFDLVSLNEKLERTDLVLTGEGQIDFQTVFGKAPGGVGAAAGAQNIPCFAIAGSIGEDLGELHETGITAVFSLCPGPMTLGESIKLSKENLSRTTEQIIRAFLAGPGRS